MFSLNLGYRWNLATVIEGLQGRVYLPQGNSRIKLTRAAHAESQSVLFDPQLYLAGLDVTQCNKVCTRLASFPWFGVNGLPTMEDGQVASAWDALARPIVSENWLGRAPKGDEKIIQACREAIEYQLQIGCAAIILPSPLASEREDEAQDQAHWLDAALDVAQNLEVGQPLIATVALSETVLSEAAFEPAGFLDTVVDQVTARHGIDGVYILIAQTTFDHPFETAMRVNRAYLQLCKAFAYHNYDTITTNFADVFGLVCMAVGATGLATGPSYPLRRLSLAGFQDESFGKALPHFYSHRAVGEFLSESHLDRIVAGKLLGRVRDATEHSAPLMLALSQGGSAADLSGWAESQNNVGEAAKHFLKRMATETAELRQLPLVVRRERVRSWLEDADANRLYLKTKLQTKLQSAPIGRFAPTDNWLEIFDAMTS